MFEWLKKESADFVCLQEVRAQLDDIQGEAFWPNNYHCYHHVAMKKGYSGVAIFTKLKPNNVIEGLGCKEFDAEGRYIECEFDDFSLASAYFPSGSSGDQRQEAKYRFLDLFKDKLEAVNLQNKGYLFCGDVNIVHQEIDITNWRANQKNSGCLPQERAWLDMIFNEDVKAFYENTELFAEKAEFSNSGSFLSISKDVKVNDPKGTMFADKLLFDIKKNPQELKSLGVFIKA